MMTETKTFSLNLNSFERKIKRLSQKDWEQLKSQWIAAIPEIEPPGSKPHQLVSDLLEVTTDVANIKEDSRLTIPGLAPLVLHEGIFFAHKAVRVATTSSQLAKAGSPTWSLSSAYQSTMFTIRSIICLFGISVGQIGENTFLIDVLPSAAKGKRFGGRAAAIEQDIVHLIQTRRFGHKEWWLLLNRILRTSKIDCWAQQLHNLKHISDIGAFSYHRNRLHYYDDWFFDDLFTQSPTLPDYNLKTNTLIGDIEGKAKPETAFYLNIFLVANLVSMLQTLSLSTVVSQELVLINSVIDQLSGFAKVHYDLSGGQ